MQTTLELTLASLRVSWFNPKSILYITVEKRAVQKRAPSQWDFRFPLLQIQVVYLFLCRECDGRFSSQKITKAQWKVLALMCVIENHVAFLPLN